MLCHRDALYRRFFEGVDFATAFSTVWLQKVLCWEAAVRLLLPLFYMWPAGYYPLDCMSCLPEGFKAMVPAILILSMAWTLKAMTDSLRAAEFVACYGTVCGQPDESAASNYFIVGCFLAFATGTSWGTFGILIPIVVAVFENLIQH